MQLIPVLDLMDGHVVRARAGRRDQYRPLQSALCRSSQPAEVVSGLLDLHPFRRLYVADLDAILGRGDHRATLEALRRAYPELELWVDAGFASPAAARDWQAGGLGRAVLGSESLAGLPEGVACPPGGLLSLDFRGEEFLGPAGLEQDARHWPDEVIVMTLARVGMGQGPDIARLKHLRGLAPGRRFYAAGGVRDGADLAALAQAGAAGVMLASALHDGIFSRVELAAFHSG
ncbi:MAG: HisA/HisF-related TIM barrel protein [Gallionellaceae bacterium]|nr:HisA/HisF-related TIM barrel protein [Gallionellaceae bacterium]